MKNGILTRFACVVLVFTLLVTTRPVGAQTLHTIRPVESAHVEGFFDTYLAEQMEMYHIPGAVISVAQNSGVPFEEYMHENILAPLGMVHSTFDQRLTQTMRNTLATGSRFEDGAYQPEPFLYVRVGHHL